MAAWILLAAVLVLVVLGILGIRRDARRNATRGTAARVVRAGFLEMQELLEPEKKVEVLKHDRKEELLVDLDHSGDPPPGTRDHHQ